MAAIKINWETVEALAKTDAVVTGGDDASGEGADEEDAEASLFAAFDRPVIVFVADPTVAMSEFEKIEKVVFANEKIGLAMKAFRAVRLSPEAAESDGVLAGEGKSVPRILVVDPVKEDVIPLDENKIKVSKLYSEMKKVAGRFYKEKLDKLVKSHLKMLTAQDRLAKEIQTLKAKEDRLSEEGDKAAKKLEKLREELADVEKELEELTVKQRELWKLTPKHTPA